MFICNPDIKLDKRSSLEGESDRDRKPPYAHVAPTRRRFDHATRYEGSCSELPDSNRIIDCEGFQASLTIGGTTCTNLFRSMKDWYLLQEDEVGWNRS